MEARLNRSRRWADGVAHNAAGDPCDVLLYGANVERGADHCPLCDEVVDACGGGGVKRAAVSGWWVGLLRTD